MFQLTPRFQLAGGRLGSCLRRVGVMAGVERGWGGVGVGWTLSEVSRVGLRWVHRGCSCVWLQGYDFCTVHNVWSSTLPLQGACALPTPQLAVASWGRLGVYVGKNFGVMGLYDSINTAHAAVAEFNVILVENFL